METLCKPPKPDKNTFTMLQNRRLGPLSSSQRAHLVCFFVFFVLFCFLFFVFCFLFFVFCFLFFVFCFYHAPLKRSIFFYYLKHLLKHYLNDICYLFHLIFNFIQIKKQGQRYIPQYGRTIGSFDHHVFCGKYSRE